MTNKMHNPNSNKRSAATMAALSAMLACQACPGQAFQPSTFLLSQPTMHLGLAGSATPLTMGCSSPWDPCYSTGRMQPFRDPMSTFVRWPRAMRGPMISGPSRPGVFHDDFHLEVADPEVQDTDQEYMLIFRLPEGVDKEDFDVSVSGHLLTVKATTTREQSGDGRSRGGWVSRSSRTDSVSRSFVLPEGVSSSGVSTRKGDDGKVEVRFNKVIGGSSDDTVDSSQAQTADGSRSSATAAADASRGDSSPLSNQESSSVRGDERGRPQSLFDAVFDEDFRDLATLMWGEDPFRFPTREEMAARAETARKERAERVRSMRRSRMATDVSEKDGSYVVRMALPEGTTRDDVALTVTPDKALRVSVSREGRRSLARDIRLPGDALLSEISAKFEAEAEAEAEEAVEDGVEGSGGGSVSSSVEGVYGLEVTVGKAAPPDPIHIDIA